MEKVERKKKRSRGPRSLLWIAGALVLTAVCVFAAVWLNRDLIQDIPEERPETRGSLVDREAGDIVRITVQARGAEPWTAVREEDGTLRLTGEEDWIADDTLAGKLEDALANVVYEEILTENQADYVNRLADFGLADPELVATAEYKDGTSVTLRFGKSSGLEDRDFRYMTVDGDSRLFAAASSLMEDLRIDRELLHPVEQPDIQSRRIDRITVRNGTGEVLTEWILEGKITDTDAAEEWVLNRPFRYPADYDTMSSLRTNAANLRLGLYIGKASEADLKALGLETPEKVLEIHLAAGTTGQTVGSSVFNAVDREAETFRFEIGALKNDMVYYVLFGDTVYTMNRFSLETLTEAEPLSTAARYPVTVEPESLQRLTVEGPEGTTVYTLYREAAETDGEEEAETVLRCEKNGTEISAEAFEAAYQRMMVVTVSGKLPEGWEKQETTVRYVFRTMSGRERVLELSPFDALHEAVTLDGCTVFYLIRDGMPELP